MKAPRSCRIGTTRHRATIAKTTPRSVSESDTGDATTLGEYRFLDPRHRSRSGSAHEGADDRNTRPSIAPTYLRRWRATPGLQTPCEDRPELKGRPSSSAPIQAPARWTRRPSSAGRQQTRAEHRKACSLRKPTSRSKRAWSRAGHRYAASRCGACRSLHRPTDRVFRSEPSECRARAH